MTRRGVALLATLIGIAAVWVGTTATAEAAYTWEGTWDSTFGDIEMDAGGSGTYDTYGQPSSISGSISGPDGRTNTGTWDEGESEGTFIFNMTPGGATWVGSYERTEGGCVFPPCAWDGTCVSGACVENSPPPTHAYEVQFEFELWRGFRRGLPSGVPRSDLPRRLLSIEAETGDARLLSKDPISDDDITDVEGEIEMKTRYRRADGTVAKRRITFEFGPDGFFKKSPGKVAVQADFEVVDSDDQRCDAGQVGQMQLQSRKLNPFKKALKLTIEENEDDEAADPLDCLRKNEFEDEELIWTTDDFKSFRIGRRQLIGSG